MNKASYQTNFSGIKYSNNPLAIDINSFSNANNVYLNKYGALISRPPIVAKTYPWQVYGTDPIPVHLKLIKTYDLTNGGELYVIRNTNSNLYQFRYKTAAGVYSALNKTVSGYNDFNLTQYKQYYIFFTTSGTLVLNTDNPANSWQALSTAVDIPITSIQTGNEILSLDGNKLTNSYKQQFVLKPDSDDTIYSLPDDDEAQVAFASQTDITYAMTKTNEYTRDRILRKLNTPVNVDSEGLVSMVGEKIAVAYPDRVHISLDYGDTFETILYPTIPSTNYKNTAGLSDDGQCFFYVHSDGVYRYMLGTSAWDLIEVVTEYSYVLEAGFDSMSIERRVAGVKINATAKGANYCHFVNPEKFAFMLAHYRAAQNQWIAVLYVKGTTLTNLFDQNLASGSNFLNSFAFNEDNVPIHIIGANTTLWEANPYLNTRMVKIVDNDTVVFYNKQTTLTSVGIILKAAPTHIWRTLSGGHILSTSIAYIANAKHTITIATAYELNHLAIVSAGVIKVLLKRTINETYWQLINISFVVTPTWDGTYNRYTIGLSMTLGATQYLYGNFGNSSIMHALADNKYLGGTFLSVLNPDNNYTSMGLYTLPLNITAANKVVISGTNYLVYDNTTERWYTNIPLLATLTFTYLSEDEFIQVPNATFNDQNIWLAIGNTLWIGNLVADKISVLPISTNKFAKEITGICPITATSKAIFFNDSITLCEEVPMNDGSVVWHYYPLKFSVGVRKGDTVLTTNEGKLTIFPTKYGLAALTYQLDIAATEQAITYLSDDIKTLWAEFYAASTNIKIFHHNTQLILSNGTNQILIYDFRTNGWYPLTMPTEIKVSSIHANPINYELLELQPGPAAITNKTGLYQFNKEHDELYTYATPYKDLGTIVIPWHLTSQILLLEAPNHYKNISQLIIDQVDSHELKQSAYLTTQLFRQKANLIKPAIELIYNIDTFAKIIKKVNWWKVLGIKWQLENDATSSYPTQLRLYNVSINYDISFEVK